MNLEKFKWGGMSLNEKVSRIKKYKCSNDKFSCGVQRLNKDWLFDMLKESIKEYIINKAKLKDFQKNPFFYLYDFGDINYKLNLLNSYATDNISIYYAMKANSNLEVLSYIGKHPKIKGVEIASVGELEKALGLFEPSQIIYTGPAKRPYELEASLKNRIRFLSAESLTEVYRINDLAAKQNIEKQDILIRINPNFEIKNSLKKMGGISSKMGIDEDKIKEALEEIVKLNNINVIGFHVFAASGILKYKDLLEYVDYVFGLITKIESTFKQKFSIIDFGGGLGVDYSGGSKMFDVKNFFNDLNSLVSEYKFESKELVLELGRFIVAESGYYVSQIVDIKESKGKKHILVSGGTNHIRLIKKHPIYIIPMSDAKIYSGQPSVKNEFVEIEGPLCFGEDKIDDDVYIEEANIGDLVVVSHVGAYGYSVASLEFLVHPKPIEYILNEV
ncbi:MAG: L-glutamyl-(BtrI acyl-carrier protein) decarboxylase [Firmicutes bacterium ADurb.Bin419]|jgi:diaminopimelate decarboxylase|nr:MAG: L-glutamyl-(BtrI acyl-carrier protein) decarboxylase [Firmicutes bacterium ADurb.Bin419]